MFKIEKNVAVPGRFVGNQNKYPWDKLDVGDSFLVSADKRVTAAVSATQYRKKNSGWNYKSAMTTDGVRFWRTA